MDAVEPGASSLNDPRSSVASRSMEILFIIDPLPLLKAYKAYPYVVV